MGEVLGMETVNFRSSKFIFQTLTACPGREFSYKRICLAAQQIVLCPALEEVGKYSFWGLVHCLCALPAPKVQRQEWVARAEDSSYVCPKLHEIFRGAAQPPGHTYAFLPFVGLVMSLQTEEQQRENGRSV